ncbi:hypothetical protein [Myxococcus eversor]|uniref:hypothetical protein n=1 Tax=Myxococcus eversor TaxID=2709661 RepID=UPI0019672844|nr:hypothetical protein [Myxococcus eversor]
MKSVLTNLKLAMDESAETKSDAPWAVAARNAGLRMQPDTGDSEINDTTFSGNFGTLVVTLNHRWRDTSRTFQPGPDRITLRLEVRQGNSLLDSYTTGYDS